MKLLILLPTLLFAACATSSGVVPVGPDTYSIARSDKGPAGSLMDVKAAAYKDAATYCAASGKTFQFIRSNDVPRAFLPVPETEVQFSCVASK